MKKLFCTALLLYLRLYFPFIIFAQNVGVGTLTPLGKLHIKGGANIPQLIIDANASQSNINPLLKLRKSDGTDLIWIHSDDSTNCFVGLKAGRFNAVSLQAIQNTFIGSRAGFSNTNGNNNTAIGANSMFSSTKANQNTAIGTNALFTQSFNPSGSWQSNNVAIGYEALYSNQPTTIYNGYNNTAVGTSSLRSNTTGYYNTGIGSGALWYNISGYDNCANGYRALYNNTTGYYNTAIGADALYLNNSHDNTAIGEVALFSNTTGYANTATGSNALIGNINGFNNTASGYLSLYYNETGSNNTAIGANALYSNTEGSNNTSVGSSAGLPSGFSRNNTVTVGYASITSENNLALLGNTTTTLNGGYGIAGWTNFSDGRFKKNIKENVPGLDFIIALRPVTYTLDLHGLNQFIYKDKTAEYETAMAEGIAEKEKIVQTGFIAQEVEQTAKKIGYDFDGVIVPRDSTQSHYMIGYASFVVPLVKAVQEQEAIIETQQSQINALLKRIEALEKK